MSEINHTVAATAVCTHKESNPAWDADYQALRDIISNKSKSGWVIGAHVVNVRHHSGELFDIFLNHLPEERRQWHNCNTCKDFFNRYGGLAIINDDGSLTSLLWHHAPGCPEVYEKVLSELCEVVESRAIDHAFFGLVNADLELGVREKGGHSHFTATLCRTVKSSPGSIVTSSAEKGHDDNLSKTHFRHLVNNLFKWDQNLLSQAQAYFKHDPNLSCYIKHVARLHDLATLKKQIIENPDRKESFIWRAVMDHGVILAHVNNQVIGEFLDCLKEKGLDQDGFNFAKKRFLDMVNPLDYMRPKADPTEGLRLEAEKFFAEMELGDSLKRRYLRFDDIPEQAFIWRTTEDVPKEETGELFGHLKTKSTQDSETVVINGPHMTWAVFMEEILPSAKSMHIELDSFSRYPFIMYGTAELPDAKPIIRWDNPDNRNPVSGVMPSISRERRGTDPSKWGISNRIVPIKAIVPSQPEWNKPKEDWENLDYHLILEKGTPPELKGVDLFPECLIPELFKYRPVLEAYRKDATFSGDRLASPVAMMMSKSSTGIGYYITVDDGTSKVRYLIDRGR